MGTGEDMKPSKPEKQSSPPPDQANVHVYPDWAAMQAYYGPRVAMPPYFNPTVASGQTPPPPPYMWGAPQPMMSAYGAPYAAFYPHGGVYPHPGAPPASTPHVETPTKSSGNTDKGLMKKLKSFDGLAMSIGPANDGTGEGAARSQSQSEETEVSSDQSNGNTMGAGQKTRKRSHEETPTPGGNKKAETQSTPLSDCKLSAGSALPSSVSANVVGSITGLELRNLPSANVKVSPSSVPPPSGVTSKTWLQDERELKRERRKQSNRESARRSRLRKQAEAEELAIKVEVLIVENLNLKSDITQLTEKSEKMKLENATLLEKLKNAQGSEMGDIVLANRVPVSTENLLSRVENSLPTDRSNESGKMRDNSTSSGGKLHQLLDSSPRADAVAAS